MKSVISLSLLGRAIAFTDEKIDHLHQKPLLADACPSNSILHNGECQLSTFDPSSGNGNVPSQPNISMSLEDARESASKIEDFHWTFWPECFSNENTTQPYCVFSDQNFAGGRGIFMVTTSELGYQMLEKPAFSTPEALERINQHSNPPFEHREFPGKGRGIIANKTLHRGDQIFASTPLVISNPGAYHLAEHERLRLSHRGVDTLPPASQTLFWNLLDHFKADPVDDRINTNAFEITIDGIPQYAVLPEIAMMNHDCRPNAAYFWDEQTLSHYVHATQTIHPGEELTITYINNERSRARRTHHLKTNWGFDCDCSACSAHPLLVAESDARIEQMQALATHLGDWSAGSAATPEMAELLLSLYEQERLFASLGVVYKVVAETYSSFGERYSAMRYARLSVELNALDKGFGDRDVESMRVMAREPEQTWSWKKRVGHGRFEGGCGHGH